MARSLTEIYTSSKQIRDQYLELTEFSNTSKMSVLDAFTWVTSACIAVFETVMETFKIDLARELQNRVNGTPAYYSNALLKYQSGDELIMNSDGTAFSYAATDETKRVVTKVSYSEYAAEGFYDRALLLKIATGTPGKYQQIEEDELLAIRAYVDKIKFAGTSVRVVSRVGDVLVPRLTVYYDGAVSESEVYKNIEQSLNDFIASADFDGVVYVQKIIDAVQRADHVLDVDGCGMESDRQGIFIASYNDDNQLVLNPDTGGYETRIARLFMPNSGFMKQSTGKDQEADLQTWREAITLRIEEK